MNLDEGDTLVAIKRIPKIEGAAENETAVRKRQKRNKQSRNLEIAIPMH